MPTRQEDNRVLVKKLERLIEVYPDQRFGQILFNYGFVSHDTPRSDGLIVWKDEFYLESRELLRRVKG